MLSSPNSILPFCEFLVRFSHINSHGYSIVISPDQLQLNRKSKSVSGLKLHIAQESVIMTATE
jgi:hypothetical protein